MSKFHFCSAQEYKDRVVRMINSNKNVYNVGSLSIDNLSTIKFHSLEFILKKYKIDFRKPTILITFHPETVDYHLNDFYIQELISALKQINSYQFVFTMPNADTYGRIIRKQISLYAKSSKNVFTVESFGTTGYLSCMKYCSFLLGNTSSGFIEASYFPKYVINLGNRQKGRILTKNINSIPITKNHIIRAINQFKKWKSEKNSYIYGRGSSSKKIVKIINNIVNE